MPNPIRELVQRLIDEHPSTSDAGISVVERDGTLELHGMVSDAAQRATASEVARSAARIGQMRNWLGTRADTGQQAAAPVSAVGYGAAWLQAFLKRASGLSFDEAQAAQVATLAERKLLDLFDVGREAALANGRMLIARHDLPLTKGLRASLGEAEELAGDLELRPLLVFLADAGVSGPFDQALRAEIPHLMAALLFLAGRIIALLEPGTVTPLERLDRLLRSDPSRPTRWELERATRVVDMTL